MLQQKAIQLQSKQRVNRSYMLQQKAVQFQSKERKQVIYPATGLFFVIINGLK